MILHYLTTAARQLIKYKTQNLIAIVGVGLALLCFSVCLYISRFINATDDCFERKDEIAQVTLQMKSGRYLAEVPPELTMKLKDKGIDFPTCIVAYPLDREYNVEVETEKFLPYTLNCMEVDTTYNQFFIPQIIVGIWQQAIHVQNAVVLFESTASRLFGTPEKAMGKRMVLGRRLYTSPQSTPKDGGIAYTVQAVIKDLPYNTSLNFLTEVHALTLNDSDGRLKNHNRPDRTGCAIFVMPGKKTITQCNQEVENRKMTYSLWDEQMSVRFTAFGELFWQQSAASVFSNITLIAGSLVLLVSLLNFFYFLIGSFLTRIREFNIRRVNGAGFGRQFLLLFVQSVLAIGLAGCITVVLIHLLAPWLHFALYDLALSINPTILMGQTFTYLIGLVAVCAFLSLIMVIKLRKVKVQSGLFGGTERYGKHRIRNILLGVQLFIGIIFITLTVALYQQAELSAQTMFGTLSIKEKENIVGLTLDYGFLNQQQRKEIVNKIKQQPGVEDVILADLPYTGGISGTGMYTEKGVRNSHMDAPILNVSPNFFSFMNIKMESGIVPALHEAVIDSELARQSKKDILGMTLYDSADRGYTVKGVCDEFCCSNQSVNGFLFLVHDFADYFGYCYVKCNPERHAEALSGIENVMSDYLPESVELQTKTLMDEIVAEQALEFEMRGIVLYMGLVTLMISLLGIYSAITLDTERRQKEMAIRKINGAKIRDIAMLFALLYIRIVVIASVLAFALTSCIFMLMKDAYNVFIDTGILFYGSIFLVVVVLVTSLVYMRIWTISRINPVKVIKNE